jgi:predicted amidohydrolase
MICGGTPGGLATVRCNADVFERAIEAGASASVDLLVFPEAYALSGTPSPSGYWEPLWEDMSSAACGHADAGELQRRLSCAASKHGVALAYSLFSLRAKSRRITTVVIDAKGRLVATYDKHRLFPIIEKKHGATPGTGPPVVFDLLGRRWGLLVCYEGVWPFLPWGNFDQLDQLVREMGATNLLWNVGADVPLVRTGSAIATRYGIGLAAAQDASRRDPSQATGTILCTGKTAQPCRPFADVPVERLPDGYRGSPVVRHARLGSGAERTPMLSETQPVTDQ